MVGFAKIVIISTSNTTTKTIWITFNFGLFSSYTNGADNDSHQSNDLTIAYDSIPVLFHLRNVYNI